MGPRGRCAEEEVKLMQSDMYVLVLHVLVLHVIALLGKMTKRYAYILKHKDAGCIIH